MNNFLDILKEKELKATPQRISVLKELSKKNHPSMEDLYEAIKKENPSISLATVYKNISMLKEKGVVIEVNISDGKMRYDIYTKPHIHLLCKNCSYIEDIEYNEHLFNYQAKLEESKKIKIERLDIIATVEYCSHCKK